MRSSRRGALVAHVLNADMRWPVNPRSTAVLPGFWSVQAGGHMGTALDHADIRRFEPHIPLGPEPASNQARAC